MKTSSSKLYLWVIVFIILGGFTGYYWPELGVALKPLGDGFISLIKMLVGPIVFCTVVLGVANAGDLKKVGRVGIKALFYFEIVSTLALIIGLILVNTIKPGLGFNIDPNSLDGAIVGEYAQKAKETSIVQFFLHLIPTSFLDAFTGKGDLLQVMVVALLFGYAMNHMGEKGKPVHHFIDSVSHIFFAMMNAVMRLAPIGAGGAMAFTIGKYGLQSLRPLFSLMGTFYLTCLIFVVLILGFIARWVGFSIFRFLAYIKEELLTVLGTSSSESALVPLMHKLENLGCSRSVVGLVMPAGYSFNLDGTNIYLSMAALFVAQALNQELTWVQQLTLLGVAMITSKGASGVTGAGFITLAATLSVVPTIPIQGLALLIGIDRFMSEARAITNMIGNGVATIAVSAWESDLNKKRLVEVLGG
ncbi:MAG: C4-dicarboxylic acid, orotate and citrate transporter [Pseudomonadota bacterium]|jgi:aerobic C4-dicarboxylate transport protein